MVIPVKFSGLSEQVIGMSFHGVPRDKRTSFLEGVERECREKCTMEQMTFEFFTIQLPCGSKVSYPTHKDVPIDNTPCSCGNEKHWFIVWTE